MNLSTIIDDPVADRRTAGCALDRATYDKLQALAKRKGMSVSKLLRFMIVEILKSDAADRANEEAGAREQRRIESSREP